MERKRILVADDEKDTLDILVKKLTKENYEVFGFSNGKDVVENPNILKPDLIILDILLGDMDGYAVASSLRKNKDLKNVPIIFMTGRELEYSGIEKRLLELGYCDFIAKPCSFEELLSKIKANID